jgi:hypothetical protein
MEDLKEELIDQLKGFGFVLAVLAAAILLWIGIIEFAILIVKQV